MSSTTIISEQSVSRIKSLPTSLSRLPNSYFYPSATDLAEENIDWYTNEQAELATVYSNQRANQRILQSRMPRVYLMALLQPELGDLTQDEYPSWLLHLKPRVSPVLFNWLASIWKADTRHLSDLTQVCSHWAYQQIMKMGRDVIPLILRELATNPDYWFLALSELTEENPVPPESRGRLKDMASAWLEWGRRNGISW